MKIRISTAWLCAGLMAPAVFADDQLPPATTGDTNKPAPAAKSKSKPAKSVAARTAAPAQPQLPLTPGPAVVNTRNANVRGKAAISSEVVTALKRGEQVNVLEEVTIKKPKTDEPARWAKIALPPSVGVWVHSDYIDGATKTVKPKRLNLRSGPGENYSVLGTVDRGTPIKEVEVKGEWVKIEAPATTFAFVASHLLQPQIAPPEPTLATAQTAAPLETAKVDSGAAPATAAEPAPVSPVATAPAEGTATALAPAESEEEVKRIVTREGLVRNTVSIQAPTYFILHSAETGKPISYLFSTNISLKEFRGHRIVVTGEEMLDERWPNTPVIAVEKLEAVP